MRTNKKVIGGLAALALGASIAGGIKSGLETHRAEVRLREYPEYNIANNIDSIRAGLESADNSLSYSASVTIDDITIPERIPDGKSAREEMWDAIKKIEGIGQAEEAPTGVELKNPISQRLKLVYDKIPDKKRVEEYNSINARDNPFKDERAIIISAREDLGELAKHNRGKLPQDLVSRHNYWKAGTIGSALGALLSLIGIAYCFAEES